MSGEWGNYTPPWRKSLQEENRDLRTKLAAAQQAQRDAEGERGQACDEAYKAGQAVARLQDAANRWQARAEAAEASAEHHAKQSQQLMVRNEKLRADLHAAKRAVLAEQNDRAEIVADLQRACEALTALLARVRPEKDAEYQADLYDEGIAAILAALEATQPHETN